jgi:hypothetical protein
MELSTTIGLHFWMGKTAANLLEVNVGQTEAVQVSPSRVVSISLFVPLLQFNLFLGA